MKTRIITLQITVAAADPNVANRIGESVKDSLENHMTNLANTIQGAEKLPTNELVVGGEVRIK